MRLCGAQGESKENEGVKEKGRSISFELGDIVLLWVLVGVSTLE
jgi:hypothetical protein